MRKDSVQQLDGVPCLLAAFRHQTWKPMVDDKSRTISVMLPLISTSVIHIRNLTIIFSFIKKKNIRGAEIKDLKFSPQSC